ncbi:hypothetical protein [Kitasatospora sp. NPDC048538]|uniref:hypothetical protein n=1 Tax=unclassified Kitasatospora TaxID=2633591 RepID=UPI0033FB36B6
MAAQQGAGKLCAVTTPSPIQVSRGGLRRLFRIAWHGGKLLVAGALLLAVAGGIIYGGFFAEDDSDSKNPPVPVAGDCVAADLAEPITVGCTDGRATVKVLQVINGDSPAHCNLVAGATGVLTHKSVLKVGGAEGINVGDLEVHTLCVKRLGAP